MGTFPRHLVRASPFLALVAIVLVMTGTGGAATQQTLYVATTGADANAGTLDHPWRTIQHALEMAQPGNTIDVLGGTYAGDLVAAQDGTSLRPIALTAYGNQKVVVRGPLRIAASWFSVSNLVFDGSASPNQVPIDISGDHVSVTRDEIRNSSMSGIFVGGGTGVRITGNWIHDNGTHVVRGVPQDHGIYVAQAQNGLIADNIIDHNLGYGIQLYPAPKKMLVTENTIVANGTLRDASHGASGVIIGGSGSSGNIVADNILVGNSECGVRSLRPLGAGNRVFSNLGYGNAAGDFPSGFYGAGLTFARNVVDAPRFVDVGARDYRLLATSPARHRADKRYAQPYDYANRRRSSRPDIGALEFVAIVRRAASP